MDRFPSKLNAKILLKSLREYSEYDAVMDYERSLINDQVENGIAVRMAVLYWLKPGSVD